MAANTPQKVYSDGLTNRFVVYRIYGITSGDTVQTSTEFGSVASGNTLFVPTTGTAVATAGVVSANTTVTITITGLSKDDGYLIVYGNGIQQ